MAVPEPRAVRGGVRLTFFSAVGGDPGESSGGVGCLGQWGSKEEGEEQGKIHSYFRQKGGCRDLDNPGGHPGKKGYPINNRKCLGLWM